MFSNPPVTEMIDLIQSAYQSARTKVGKEFADIIKMHAARHSRELQRLQKAAFESNKSVIRSSQHRILKSLSSKLTCLVRALPVDHNLSGEQIVTLADELSAFEDCGEPILAWMQPKSFGGGERPICDFGMQRKALHYLLGDVLRAKFPSATCDYMVKGRGGDLLAKTARSLIEGGKSWVFTADLSNFYRSVQQTQLQDLLGLPIGVVSNSLLIPLSAPLHDAFSYVSTPPVFDGAVREGLPQGSGASGLVASMLLGTWLDHSAPTGHVFLNGDDIMVIAGDELELKAFEMSLLEYLSNHPHGPFQLKHTEIVNAEAGFDFCKYRFKRDVQHGGVRLTPSNKSYFRAKIKIMKMTKEHPFDVYHRLEKYIERWAAAFPLWERNDQSMEYLWAMADEAIQDVKTHGLFNALAMMKNSNAMMVKSKLEA